MCIYIICLYDYICVLRLECVFFFSKNHIQNPPNSTSGVSEVTPSKVGMTKTKNGDKWIHISISAMKKQTWLVGYYKGWKSYPGI